MDAAMGMMGLGIVLTLRDQVSHGLDKLREKLAGFKNLTQETVKTFDSAAKQIMGGFGMMWAGSKTLNAFNSTFGASVQVAASFEQAMARVKAVANATPEVFDKLREKAEQLGRETQFTPMDAASALETIIRAGQTSEQALKSVDSVLQLAAADGLSLAESADMISSSMNMFGKKAEEASDIANLFAQASRSSSLDSRTLAEALSYAGTTAKQAGMSIGETVGWISVLSDAGLKSSRAGTALNRIIPALSDDKVRGKLINIGVSFTDDKGKPLSKIDVFQSLGEKLQDMSRDNAVNFLHNTFAQLGQGAAGILADAAQSGRLEAAVDKMRNFGTASKDMMNIMTDTLPGAMKYLESATMGLDIAIGDIFKDSYRWFIKQLGDFKNWLTDIIKTYPTLSKVILGGTGAIMAFAGAALIAGGAIMAIGGTVKMWKITKNAARIAFTAIKTQAGTVKTALMGMSTPILWLIALAGALYLAYKTNFGGIRDMFEAISTAWSFASEAAKNKEGKFLIDPKKEADLKKRGLWDSVSNMTMLFYRLDKFGEGFGKGFLDGLNKIKEVLDSIIDSAGKFFGSLLGDSKPFLELLGIWDTSKTDPENWEAFGEAVGKLVGLTTGIVGLAVAFKTLAVAVGLFNFAAHPLYGLLATLVLIISYWDQIKKMFTESAITHPEGLSYADTVRNYEAQGLIINKEGRASYADSLKHMTPIEQKYLADVNANLARARERDNNFNNLETLQRAAGVQTAKDAFPIEAKGLTQLQDGLPFSWAKEVFKNGGINPRFNSEEGNTFLAELYKRAGETDNMVAAQYLAQAAQHQAAAVGQATADASAANPGKPVQVQNRVNVDAKIASTPVLIDGEKIAEIIHKIAESVIVRNGSGDDAWGAITGLGF